MRRARQKPFIAHRRGAVRSQIARVLLSIAGWLTRGLDRDWCDVCNDCTPHAHGRLWRRCARCTAYVEEPDHGQ